MEGRWNFNMKPMKQIFIKLFKNKISQEDISNEAVGLALAWGKDWLKPIQSRLAKKFDFLSAAELDAYNSQSQEVLKEGFGFINKALETASAKGETISESELEHEFKSQMKDRFPWINMDNQKRIFSQGLYYTWKEGLNDCIR